MKFSTRKRNVKLIIRDYDACDLFAGSVGQTNDAKFFYVRRIGIKLLKLIRVHILAVCVDDDLFRTTHKIQISIVVQATEVSCVQPSLDESISCRALILVI